ncbi:MAG: hypothetical protein CMJ69_21550 [Planctomycetaceae bacterium]|nr:hypothetical protein [Planctomycetaceae bacterium]
MSLKRRPKQDENGGDDGEDDVEESPMERPIPASTSRTRLTVPNKLNPILWRLGAVRSTQPRMPPANRLPVKPPLSPGPTETAHRQNGEEEEDDAGDVVEMPIPRTPIRHPRPRTAAALDQTIRN